MKRVFQMGEGRIFEAIKFYLRGFANDVSLVSSVKDADVIINTLPGNKDGHKGLEWALEYQKDFLDVADLEPEFYTENRDAIRAANIVVVPGCGFCPGIVNFLIGREISVAQCENIEVMVGTISQIAHFFPHLWCFEDMMLEFLNCSTQVENGVVVEHPAFAAYREECFYDIAAESYYCQSGFENLAAQSQIKNFTYRNIRPRGYKDFFLFLHQHGLLSAENLMTTKELLEKRQDHNLSLACIRILQQKDMVVWDVMAESQKHDQLNSIQKITALFSVYILQFIIECGMAPGLYFVEELGKNAAIFDSVLCGMRKEGIQLSRSTRRCE